MFVAEPPVAPAGPPEGARLFVLPLPDAVVGRLDLPEPPSLRQGARGRRALVKYRFWRALMLPDLFKAVTPYERKVREPIDPQRLQLMEVGLADKHKQRMAEQPMAVSEAILERSPQFTLRNLPRYEKDAWVDALYWQQKVVRALQHELGLDDVRRMKIIVKIVFMTEFGIDAVRDWTRDWGHLLRDTDWSTLYFKGGRILDKPWRVEKKELEDSI